MLKLYPDRLVRSKWNCNANQNWNYCTQLQQQFLFIKIFNQNDYQIFISQKGIYLRKL